MMPAYQESFAEQIQAQAIVVLHPGSRYLRIGRASDLNPSTILHAVALKKSSGGQKHRDQLLVSRTLRGPSRELVQEMEEARLQVSHTLQSCLQSNGTRRYATPPQQIAVFNRRSQPEVVGPCDKEWIWPSSDVVVGDEILSLNPSADYNVHFPIRRGELNLHEGPGGSLTAILSQLEILWGWAIKTKLGISQQDLKHYRAVLVIPDVYNRQHLRELTNLLLCRLEFGGCFLVQDHVAATFGAGLGFSCVVDVGDQKTSISCVEDGISHRTTKVRLEYGGADVTQSFYWLLQKCGFPYHQCNPKTSLDAILLHQLKESFCHVDLDVCGPQEKTFLVEQPGAQRIKYTLQVGDECIIAPLSLFQPELLGASGPKAVHSQKRSTGDPEDPHDENYLRETSRRGAKEALEAGVSGSVGLDSISLSGGPAGDSSQLENTPMEEDIVVDALDSSLPTGKDMEKEIPDDALMGIDQAILLSIDRCPTEELKRKMYSCILVVGGGMNFAGIGTWLHHRITLQTPYIYRSDQLEIITKPKDMDPMVTTWKGAAIMSCLESAQELWIRPKEWTKIGVKVLRERAPFMW